MNALTPIIDRTRTELAERRRRRPAAELERQAAELAREGPRRPFAAALSGPELAVIAEHKRRSPSAGLIRDELELEHVVGAYEQGGAAALSILTEEEGFGGRLEDLGRARAASRLPILRKDFMIDPYQVPEALVAGADAILLIVAALTAGELSDLNDRARAVGLAVLVEVHDERELETALSIEPELLGINNRDLATLHVDVARTLELRPRVPDGITVVAESGFRTRAELDRLAAAGVDAVLVGESLMRAPDVRAACQALTGPAAIR
jgi:indole-3-glycerol phosphate synthase